MTLEAGDDIEAEGAFTPLGTVAEPVAIITTAMARSGYRVYRAKDGFEAAVPFSVIERCVAWGLRAEPNEWYGLIVGKLCTYGGQTHVVVLGVVPDPDAIGRPHSVETTSDSEFRTRTSARLLYPDGIVLGWVHGHLRHGVRFSSTDRGTQRTWTQPHSLGIVVDPWNGEQLSVYRGPDSERLKLVETTTVPGAAPRQAWARRVRQFGVRVFAYALRHRRVVAWFLAAAALALVGFAALRMWDRLGALEAAATRDRLGMGALTARSPVDAALSEAAADALPEGVGSCPIVSGVDVDGTVIDVGP